MKIQELSKDQLHTLRHMLGINTPNDRNPKPYRNYAAVEDGDPEYVTLENLGMVEKKGRTIGGTYQYYKVTDLGKFIALKSHRTIRNSRSKRRYSMFLKMRDIDPDLTFKEFLTDDKWVDARMRA